jgi:hypothetical protein
MRDEDILWASENDESYFTLQDVHGPAIEAKIRPLLKRRPITIFVSTIFKSRLEDPLSITQKTLVVSFSGGLKDFWNAFHDAGRRWRRDLATQSGLDPDKDHPLLVKLVALSIV